VAQDEILNSFKDKEERMGADAVLKAMVLFDRSSISFKLLERIFRL
jgi:hypothetical protein